MSFSLVTFSLKTRAFLFLELLFLPRRAIRSSRTRITVNDGRSAASLDQLSKTSVITSSFIPSGRDGRSPPFFFCVNAVICAHVNIDSPSSFLIMSEYGVRSVSSSHITMANEKTSADVS